MKFLVGFGAATVANAVIAIFWPTALRAVREMRAECDEVRLEAIEHNAAHWHVEPDGSTEFRWNEPREGEDE